MKAIFSPGPSYSDPNVRQYAGWVRILDLYREGLEELGYEVFVPQVLPELIDSASTVSKILSYDVVAATQLPTDADLFLGPPGYSLAQMMRLERPHTKAFLYVWNNADWWRDEQLAEEYKKHGAPYDLSPAWRWINKTALEMCDHVVACSPWVKWTHSKVVSESKISITSWGVDSQMFIPAKEEPSGFRVLFVGGDPIRKGLPYLVQAMQRLNNTELWIAGCAPFPKPAAGEHPWIRQFGMVPHSEMPDIYRQCHVLCIPTLEDGVALAIQEGIASGLVPVTSPETAEVFINRPGEAFGINKSGVKVDYRDIEGIRSALQILRDCPDIRRQMAASARALAETQSWAETKRQFKEVIQTQCH